MARHLILRLEAPLMSFGTVAVDHRRPVQAWPAVSMLTGLFANALGWHRQDADALDRLQSRLRWAARIDRPGVALQDFQTAQLAKDDRGWTTRGTVEERGGGDDTYRSPHLRFRDYRADASVAVAVRLDEADATPSLDTLAAALDAPQRPLFIGRKSCPPAVRLAAGWVDACDAVAALLDVTTAEGSTPTPALYCNEGAAAVDALAGWRIHRISDERRFGPDQHAGIQRVYERLPRSAA